MPPPWLLVELPEIVLLVIVTVPLLLEMPPAKPAAFPLSVQLVTFSVPPLLLWVMPPPKPLGAWFPLSAQLVTFTVPVLPL